MIAVIILAAGQGTRMKSTTPKVFHLLGGKPILSYVLEAARAIQPQQVVLVTSKVLQSDFAKVVLPLEQVTIAIQPFPQGTADAVKIALSHLDPTIEKVIIIGGDTPLLKPETLERLKSSPADFNIIGMPLQNSDQTYGRILCDQALTPLEIIEYKDATPTQRQIPWANSGVYKIKVSLLKNLLPLIKCGNAAQEYYLTDLLKLAHKHNYSRSLTIAEAAEFQGINTRQDLTAAEQTLQQRWRENLMNQGVTLGRSTRNYFLKS